MEREKVRLSKKGEDFLNNRNCSTIVGAVLHSIDIYSAEVIDWNDTFVRVKLSEYSLSEELIQHNCFSVHRDHLVVV
ncbi:MAG: hypothetical protein PF518_12285 [Spirochaetaceae bacterium]|nr:hypothetical protein [Spirochaetaceae bacterium]